MQDINEILQGVTKGWMTVLMKDDGLTRLSKILDNIDYTPFIPAKPDILSFAKYNFRDIKVIILGMDPYFKPEDKAHGLAFSSRGDKCPVSLNRIYSVLIDNKLLKEQPTTFDLGYLASQGIVLLNSALTCEVGKPGGHMKYWQSYIDSLITNLSQTLPPNIIWCLWGNHARSKVPLIDTKHLVLQYCHPVAMTNPSFSSCDHFKTISTRYPNLIWDPKLTETHFEIQCDFNGYVLTCTKGLLLGKTWNKILEPANVMYRGQIVVTPPNGFRAEGFALCKALQLSHNLLCVKILNISQIWYDMIYTHMPNWIQNDIHFESKKNSDITIPLYRLIKDTKVIIQLSQN